ncbi:hypothetical protein RBB50_000440 [Rhinocladiella similis]
MAAVATKATGTATKMKKPPAPILQTNTNGTKPAAPSSSPTSARKTLPGQSQTPTSAASNTAGANGTARPNRRLQRLNTRNSTTDAMGSDKRGTKKFPEPYVPKESHILRKFKGCTPSLIVHLHPTHFRFDQQEGSFSYHSEMRIFIEHLAKGTIPHDMVEEFRKSEVRYYDGWLIVRVLDYKSVAKDAAANDAATGDEEPFSIHNYNQYITPSPYVPYPTKEQSVARSPPTKQEHRDSIPGELKDAINSDDTIDVVPKSMKPKPKIYHVALRPTILSKHMDLVIDAMTPDPKSVNRKGQANSSNRATGSAVPQTPISGVPSTPSTDKGPPHKKLKLKIDPRDLIDYEARVVNATAPPLYLDAVESIEEAETLMEMLRDPYHDARPLSPISRKRTVAELAADDAHAKGQEKFMLVMDERTSGASGAPNAGAVDGQAASALFQPRFEKFNALDNIKREIAERKQREKDRQLQEDENRRGQQELMQEEEKKRIMMQRAQEARVIRARQQEMQAALAAQQQQTAQTNQRPPSQQMNGIPPNMQNQIMAAQQQRGSPVLRQGTPHAVSSPVVTSATAQGGLPMAVSGSQQGHGSPARPGSAVQHAHPTAPMARVGSGQAPSRNGTPQLAHGTPAGGNATPIIRQGTPAQHISQASPHSSMAAPTPQMMPNGMIQGMQGQMPNGVQRQPNPQQLAEMQRRHAMQQQAAAQQAAMHQQMINGTPQMAQAQMAHMQAQHHAQMDRQAAMQRQQAQQQAMQQGTPQSQHMSPVPAQNQKAYNQAVVDHVKAQMQSLQQPQSQGSPGQNHQMTPQQQAAQMAQAQQQQRMMAAQAQNQMMGGNGPPQQRPQINPQLQQLYQTTLNAYTQRFLSQAASKYGGNTNMLQPAELQQVQAQAKQAAMTAVRKRQAEMSQMQQLQQAQMRQQAQQGGGGMNMNGGGMGMNVNPNMAAALQQHQAQQMQQMQMQHAQQMMAQQQHQQQQQQQQPGMQFQHQRG